MISDKFFPEHMPPGLIGKFTHHDVHLGAAFLHVLHKERIKKLRLGATESIVSSCYDDLDLVSKGPLCKPNPPSEVDCRCMILGSYVSYMFSALEIRTHESHDYNALGKETKYINQKSYHTVTHFPKNKLIGKGTTERKTCCEVVNIAARVKKIRSNIPSPVLDEHRTHMVAQAKK
jgi:hypothetical protein